MPGTELGSVERGFPFFSGVVELERYKSELSVAVFCVVRVHESSECHASERTFYVWELPHLMNFGGWQELPQN